MTLEPLIYAQPVQIAKNRRGSLIACGILTICVGLVCLGLAGLMTYHLIPRLAVRASRSSYSRSVIQKGIVLLSVFVCFGAVLVWLGIGMIRCRGWVKTIGYAAAVIWLSIGLLTFESMLLEFPDNGSDWTLWLATGIVFAALVVLPAVYLRLFTRESVAQTLDAYDPHPTWSENRPRAVVAVAIWSGAAALFLAASIPWDSARFFSHYLEGEQATAVECCWAMIFAITCFFCLYAPRCGWWMAVIAITLFAASALTSDTCEAGLVTLSTPLAVIDRPGTDIIGKIYHQGPGNNFFIMMVSWLAAMIYLIKVRLDFRNIGPQPAQPA